MCMNFIQPFYNRQIDCKIEIKKFVALLLIWELHLFLFRKR
jgi:hypothetical protein